MAKNVQLEKCLREEILAATVRYYEAIHKKSDSFKPGDRINYAGRCFDERDIINLVESSLDFWLTEGRFSEEFSGKIADFLNVDNVVLTNSGSSANLLAFSALTSKKLGDKKLNKGDEVIAVAAGFPATVAPIIQYGMTPVFVDIEVPTYNIDIEMLRRAVTDRTRCIFIAHTLGNPFNVAEVLKIAGENDLWVIEDNCDAFGSRYNGKYTGTFGHLSTISFYPAHHITTGEGGAVVTNDDELAKIVRSFRDWGRDCYCAGGETDTCGKRFTQQFGALPLGYDHKYVYSELGYNLKMTDMQAAIGCAQMDKLSVFCERRKRNFNTYQRIFAEYKKYFILPEATKDSDPAWFSYIISVKNSAPFDRNCLVKYLNGNGIETRNIFAGNIIRQPGFMNSKFRIAEHLNNTDFVMNNSFFLGTYPGLNDEMIGQIGKVVSDFMGRY